MKKKYFSIFIFIYLFSNTLLPQEPDYLIVSPESLYDSAVKLKEYRESTGYSVKIIQLKEIANTTITNEKIDAWIENYNSKNEGLEYVVLLGNTQLIPTYISKTTYKDPEYEVRNNDIYNSDLWYSVENDSLNSNYTPSIAVGRIPILNNEQFSTYFHKIKKFETNEANSNSILFFGNEIEMNYYAVNRDIAIAQEQGYNTIYLIDPTEEELFQALNTTDLKAVLYYGHGSYYANSPLTNENIKKWLNDNNPVLYFSGGCNFNDVTIGTASLGNSLLKSSGGSISSIGAAINGGYGYDYLFIKELLLALQSQTTIGKLYNYAFKKHYEETPDNSVGSWSYNFSRCMNFNGDPGLIINSKVTASVSNEMISSVDLYPNPTSNILTIDTKLPIINIEIYSVLGKKVKEVNSNFDNISLNDLSNGIYLLRIKSENGYAVKKIMKQ